MNKFLLTAPLWYALLIFCTMLNHNCKKPDTSFPKEIADYIHIPKQNPTFATADRYKYDLDYLQAEKAFTALLKDGKIKTQRDSFYCINQLAYLNTCMYKDSIANDWIKRADELGGPSVMEDEGAKGDYWLNKGKLQHRSAPEIANHAFYTALTHMSKAYGESHVRTAECKTDLGLWCAEYQLDSAYNFILDANVFYTSDSTLDKYSLYNTLGMSTLANFDRNNGLGVNLCLVGIKKNQERLYFDSILQGRFYGQLMDSKINNLTNNRLSGIDKDILIAEIPKDFQHCEDLLSGRDDYYMQKYYYKYSFYYFWGGGIGGFPNYLNKLEMYMKNKQEVFLYPDLLKCNYYFGKTFMAKSSNERKYLFAESKKHGLSFYRKYTTKRHVPSDLIENINFLLIQAFLGLEEFETALTFVKHDLIFNTQYEKDADKLTWKDLKSEKIIQAKNYQFFDYQLAAEIFKTRYDKSNSDQDFQAAYDLYMLCDSILHKSILSGDEDAAMKILNNECDGLYNEALDMAYQKHLQNPGDKKYLNDAFNLIERRKSFVLFNHLREARLEQPPHLRRILSSLYEINDKISKEHTSDEERLNLNVRKVNIQSELDRIYPAYKYKTHQDKLSTDKIKAELEEDKAIIEYYIATSYLYLMVFTKETATLKRIDIVEDTLNKRIKNFYNSFNSEKITQSFNNDTLSRKNILSSINLYNVLLGSIRSEIDHIPNLIIIPDKALSVVPFDALLYPHNKKETPYEKLEYVLDKHNVSYSFSYKIYSRNSIYQPKTNPKIAIFKHKDFTNKFNKIDNIFPESAVTEIKNCTKSGFCENFDSTLDIVHIAVHGANTSSLKNSCKFLFNDSSDVSQMLYGLEILKLDMRRAPLVVLASCEGALGNSDFSEGPYSMTRYFFQAGAGCVISPISQIDPSATSTILSMFYLHLKNGSTPSQALWRAKKEYFEDKNNSHEPYYWATMNCYI